MGDAKTIDAATGAVRSVVAAWQSDTDLCNFAVTGAMVKVSSRKELDRKEVCQNYTVLVPVVKHLGNLSKKFQSNVKEVYAL